MSLPQNIDQIALGIERLIHQWKDKPNVVGLLTSYLESVQEVEDIYNQLLTERGVDTAIGAQLDILGRIVGEPRNSRNDDDYRNAIRLRISINTSDGTEGSVSDAIKLITGVDDLKVVEIFPAGLEVTLEGENITLDQNIADELRKVVAATVSLSILAIQFLLPPFVFENDPDGEGFADIGSGSFVYNLVFDDGSTLGTNLGDTLIAQNPDIIPSQEDYDLIDGGYMADIQIFSV